MTEPRLRRCDTILVFSGYMTHPNSLDTPSEGQTSEQTPESPVELNETSFGDILSQFEQTHRQAENVSGRVITITEDSIIIDVGRKTEGRLPLEMAQSAGVTDLK